MNLTRICLNIDIIFIDFFSIVLESLQMIENSKHNVVRVMCKYIHTFSR